VRKVSHKRLQLNPGPKVGNKVASKVGNKKPGIGNISKVAKNAAATRVFQNIKSEFFLPVIPRSVLTFFLAGTGGKGGEGDTEGGIGGGGGSTKFKLSPGANYEFNDVECEARVFILRISELSKL
jgi:hypothetical protein